MDGSGSLSRLVHRLESGWERQLNQRLMSAGSIAGRVSPFRSCVRDGPRSFDRIRVPGFLSSDRLLNLRFKLSNLHVGQLRELRTFGGRKVSAVLHTQAHEERSPQRSSPPATEIPLQPKRQGDDPATVTAASRPAGRVSLVTDAQLKILPVSLQSLFFNTCTVPL
jgi:hypothetical protein